MARDPYIYFRIEARELLDQLVKGALDLEKGADASELVARLLRLAHTLKGAARVVKQRDIADHAHAIEDLLEPIRDAGDAVPQGAIDALLKILDAIGVHVAALEPAAAAVSDKTDQTLLPDETLRMLRADVAEMDLLLDGVAETRARLTGLRRTLGTLGDIRRLADGLVEQRPSAGRERRLLLADDHGLASDTRRVADLRAALAGFQQKLSSSIDHVDRELQQLRSGAERLRLIPAGALFNMLERTARDAAQSLGKRIRFVGRGGEVRLDGQVLGAVQGALVQLVRNAVAHGIEAEARRNEAGKQADGLVMLNVARRGRRIIFSCTDDGGGIDVEALCRVARAKGLPIPAADGLGAQDLLRLLLSGGISTSKTVTEVSGRGIGLDILREAVDRLGGEVAVNSEAGKGTTIELAVPLSVASLGVMQFETPGGTAAIPLDAVRRIMRVKPEEMACTAEGEAVPYDGQTIPFVPISTLVGAATARRRGSRPTVAVVVEGASGLAALGVGRLLGTATVVVRPLPDLAPAAPIVVGTSLDADGNPRLVLDPDELVAAARRATVPQHPPAASPRPLLVIDDSLTTRMLEQSILESAGYRVHAATSAEDGLDAARRGDYALFLVDVEMPGMDGFTFVEQVRRDPDLRETPALLITSRASPEDRRRGLEAGAQGYIVKSEFDQGEFLQRVRQLVG